MSFGSQARYRAYFCGGKHCTGRGSKQLLLELEKQVEKDGLQEEIDVMCGACTQHCEQGPTLCIYPGPIYYSRLTRESLERIVKEHFTENRPVKELFFKDPQQSRNSNRRY